MATKTWTINQIEYKGRTLPCRITMGALLRFKEQAGHELPVDKQNIEVPLEDNLMFLYCCVQSACNADKVEFKDSFLDFVDNTDPGQLAEWLNAQSKATAQKAQASTSKTPPAKKK